VRRPFAIRLRILVGLLVAVVPLYTFGPAFANPKPGPDKRGQAAPPPKGDDGLGCKTLDFTNPMSTTACVT
jgi:hypothetical protein